MKIKKDKRSITVDASIWKLMQARARRLRVSTSWLAEEAFRDHLIGTSGYEGTNVQEKECRCSTSG